MFFLNIWGKALDSNNSNQETTELAINKDWMYRINKLCKKIYVNTCNDNKRSKLVHSGTINKINQVKIHISVV